MGIEVSPSRPLAQLVVRALDGRPMRRTKRSGQYSPHPAQPCHDALRQLVAADTAFSIGMVGALLTGEFSESLIEWMDPNIVVWTPTVTASGRGATLDAFRSDDPDGDTLTEITIDAVNVDMTTCHIYVEWRLTGRFTNACFVDDDRVVEPTGRLAELSGVLVATVADGCATAVNCYYDDMAILEQLVTDR